MMVCPLKLASRGRPGGHRLSIIAHTNRTGAATRREALAADSDGVRKKPATVGAIRERFLFALPAKAATRGARWESQLVVAFSKLVGGDSSL